MALIHPYQSFPPLYDWWAQMIHWDYDGPDGIIPAHVFMYGWFNESLWTAEWQQDYPDETIATAAALGAAQMHQGFDDLCGICLCMEYRPFLPRWNQIRSPPHFRNSCGLADPPSSYPIAVYIGRCPDTWYLPWPPP